MWLTFTKINQLSPIVILLEIPHNVNALSKTGLSRVFQKISTNTNGEAYL